MSGRPTSAGTPPGAPVWVPVLLYHSLDERASPRYRPFSVAPERFDEHLDVIRDRGHTPITAGAFARALLDPASPLPGQPVVITFDDGFRDLHEEALPRLVDRGFVATAFIVTGYVGGNTRWLVGIGEGDRPVVGWTELAELAGAGVEIGSHTHLHPQLDVIPRAAMIEELSVSRTILEDRLGQAVDLLAYPYGFHDCEVAGAARAAGYVAAYGVKNALSHRRDDPYAIARLVVGPDLEAEQLAAWLDSRGAPTAWSGERWRTRVFRAGRRAARRLRGDRAQGLSP